MEARKEIQSNSDMDERIVYTIVQKEANLSTLHCEEEKEMSKLIHIKIQRVVSRRNPRRRIF